MWFTGGCVLIYKTAVIAQRLGLAKNREQRVHIHGKEDLAMHKPCRKVMCKQMQEEALLKVYLLICTTLSSSLQRMKLNFSLERNSTC